MGGKQFGYCVDPVVIGCAVLYVTYRFWLKKTWLVEIPFFPNHFNDVLCVPLFLPGVLWVHRYIGLRMHDGRPTAFEVLFHLVVWSICFEGIAPLFPSVYRTTADWGDVAAYAIGALGAGLWWGTWRNLALESPPRRFTLGGLPHATYTLRHDARR